MKQVWVDTDFGFDDLWALLVLRHFECEVAGVSLVAGNAPLAQVTANALGAKQAYMFDWPVWRGAAQPLQRSPETAQRILGPNGMKSRGQYLPRRTNEDVPVGAVAAMQDWLNSDALPSRTVLALGPMTNIADLLQHFPEMGPRITRLVWMGGSTGAGNHTPYAEFNAVADAEALAVVASAGVQLDIVDLTFCRQHIFREGDMPETDGLTGDLLGGYLDIAHQRGRPGMAIYDPLAALAVAAPDSIGFTPCDVVVSTNDDETYGATRITKVDVSKTRVATHAQADLARLCLSALDKEALHGARL